MKTTGLFFSFYFLLSTVSAQFAPQAGVAGSTAIIGSSSQFTGWATGCTVVRGYKDINQKSLGYVTAGDSSLALGASDVSTVSLGDSGIAVLTFSGNIYDGPGPDFAVFENGFANPVDATQAFLELAFVEVSSDGVHFFRFQTTSHTQDTVQIRGAGDYMDASLLNNLAGKYIANYGTPFDLNELAGTPGLDINNITHVRVVDVVGSIGNGATHDKDGNIINDPYPTPYATGGFDLDAVGAIHIKPTAVTNVSNNAIVSIYPNPTTNGVSITNKQETLEVTVTDITGKTLLSQTILQGTNRVDLSKYNSGVYYFVLQDTNGSRWVEKVVKF